MVEKIIKRDGREEVFAKSKIVHAISQAMERAGQNDMDAVNRIADEIANTDKKVLDVEAVQDMVELKLMKTSSKISPVASIFRKLSNTFSGEGST